MHILLILFFASLLGIVLMIGRKMILLKNQPIMIEERVLIQSPNLQEIKYTFTKKTREYGYIVLVGMIRFSIRSSKILKHHYHKTKTKIKHLTRKHITHKKEGIGKEIEVSGFLKKISEYKRKIKKIREQVIEEEKQNS